MATGPAMIKVLELQSRAATGEQAWERQHSTERNCTYPFYGWACISNCATLLEIAARCHLNHAATVDSLPLGGNSVLNDLNNIITNRVACMRILSKMQEIFKTRASVVNLQTFETAYGV